MTACRWRLTTTRYMCCSKDASKQEDPQEVAGAHLRTGQISLPGVQGPPGPMHMQPRGSCEVTHSVSAAA